MTDRQLFEALREARYREPAEPARRSRLNGEVEKLTGKIRAYENKYGVDSETMRAELSTGSRQETWEICQWLLAVNLRDRLVARTR